MEHSMLVSGPDLETCQEHIRLFFEKSQLVHYDTIEFDPAACMNAADSGFKPMLETGLAENHRVLAELMEKLRQEGCSSLEDILQLEQGFKSKMLHTMSHLLDGFFGIDSRLYDIDEISHWITADRRKLIEEEPERCWLLLVKAKSVYGQGFEKKED